jgi:hypothetical protein
LPERHPITGIKFDYTPPSDPKMTLVVVTTPSRIYQFFGPIDKKSDEVGRAFGTLFATYRETAPSKRSDILVKCNNNHFTEILELPGNLQYSELQFWTPNPEQALSLPKRMAWLTGGYIFISFPFR